MGNTIIEKIIKHNTGAAQVKPGDIVTVNVDRVMIHDIFIPFVADKFEEMGFKKLWDLTGWSLSMTIWFRPASWMTPGISGWETRSRPDTG